MSEDGENQPSAALVAGRRVSETVQVAEPVLPDLVCSARACRHHAVWALRWNNPSLHTPDRRKTWLACDDHRESLSQFLSMRGFLRETMDAGDLPGHHDAAPR